jgi:hypothetical protein
MGSCTRADQTVCSSPHLTVKARLGLVRLYFGEFRDALGGIDKTVASAERPMDLRLISTRVSNRAVRTAELKCGSGTNRQLPYGSGSALICAWASDGECPLEKG